MNNLNDINKQVYNDYLITLTSKKGILEECLLNKIPLEIINSISGSKEHVNEIKQGINKYIELKNKVNLSYKDNVNLFKTCYVLGLFDGDKEYAKFIYDYILNEIIINNKYNIIKIFEKFEIEKGYNKYISKLILEALKDPYFINNLKHISIIYNDYNKIKVFVKNIYKRYIYPKKVMLNHKDKLTEEDKILLNRFNNIKPSVSLNEIKYYLENNKFEFRSQNQELYKIAPYLEGMIKADLDKIEDIYELSKGVKKKLINTKDKDDYNIAYQWSVSDNPYNLVLGYIVNCCAKLGIVGEDIMIQAMINPNIQNLLILNKDKIIIAKATAYYNEEEKYILFNNVEASLKLINTKNRKEIKEAKEAIKRAVLDQVIAQNNKGVKIKHIRIGMTKNDLFTSRDLKVNYGNYLSNYPYKDYAGDANSYAGQGILYKREVRRK